MYTDLLLTPLPLVVRRRLLDFSPLHDDANNNKNKRVVDYRQQQQQQQEEEEEDQREQRKQQQQQTAPADPVTAMWEQELASVRNMDGGGASLTVMPHWLETVNPTVDFSSSAASSSAFSSGSPSRTAAEQNNSNSNSHIRHHNIDQHPVLDGFLSLPSHPSQLTAHRVSNTAPPPTSSSAHDGSGSYNNFASVSVFPPASPHSSFRSMRGGGGGGLGGLGGPLVPITLPPSAESATFLALRDPKIQLQRKFQTPVQRNYMLRTSQDALYRDLEMCAALMHRMCDPNAESSWLVGSRRPFLGPLEMSRTLLDRLVACLHDHRQQQMHEQQQNIASSASSSSSTFPLALVAPSRLVATVSFAQPATPHLSGPLADFLSRCFYLGRGRRPLYGEATEMLWSVFALGGVVASAQISGSSYRRAAASSLLAAGGRAGGGGGGSSSDDGSRSGDDGTNSHRSGSVDSAIERGSVASSSAGTNRQRRRRTGGAPFSGMSGSHTQSMTFSSLPPQPVHVVFGSAPELCAALAGVPSDTLSSVYSARKRQQDRLSRMAHLSGTSATEASRVLISTFAAVHSAVASSANVPLPMPVTSDISAPSIEIAHRALLVAKEILEIFSILNKNPSRGENSNNIVDDAVAPGADSSVPIILRCDFAVEKRKSWLLHNNSNNNNNEGNHSPTSGLDYYSGASSSGFGGGVGGVGGSDSEKVYGISCRWVPELIDIRAILEGVANERRPTLEVGNDREDEDYNNNYNNNNQNGRNRNEFRRRTSRSSSAPLPTLAKKPLRPLAMKLVHVQTVTASGTSQLRTSEESNNVSNMNDEGEDDDQQQNQNQNQQQQQHFSGDYEDIVTDALMNVLQLAADLELAAEQASHWHGNTATAQRPILSDATNSHHHLHLGSHNAASKSNFSSRLNNQHHQRLDQNQQTIAFCEAMRADLLLVVQRGLSLDHETSVMFVDHVLDESLTLVALRSRLRSFAADVMWSALLWIFDATHIWTAAPGAKMYGPEKPSTFRSSIRLVGSGSMNRQQQENENERHNQTNRGGGGRSKNQPSDATTMGAAVLESLFEEDDYESIALHKILSDHDAVRRQSVLPSSTSTSASPYSSSGSLRHHGGANHQHQQQQQQANRPNPASITYADFEAAEDDIEEQIMTLTEQLEQQQQQQQQQNQNREEATRRQKQQRLDLLSKFKAATSISDKALMPHLSATHPLYSRILRICPHDSARVLPIGTRDGVLLSDEQLVSGGTWNLWAPDTRERLLMPSTVSLANFVRSPRGRMLLNPHYVAVAEKQTWRTLTTNAASTSASSLQETSPAVIFVVSRGVISTRNEMQELTRQHQQHQTAVRESSLADLSCEISAVFGYPHDKNSHSDDDNFNHHNNANASFSSTAAIPTAQSNHNYGVCPVNGQRDEQIKAAAFLWRNVVGMRAAVQAPMVIDVFLAQFWIVVAHANWQRTASFVALHDARTRRAVRFQKQHPERQGENYQQQQGGGASRTSSSILLLDRLFAIERCAELEAAEVAQIPSAEAEFFSGQRSLYSKIKPALYTFPRRKPLVAAEWIALTLGLKFVKFGHEGKNKQHGEDEDSDDADDNGEIEHSSRDDLVDFTEQMQPSESKSADIVVSCAQSAVFVNGFDTMATLGFARKQALLDSCVPLIADRFIAAALALRARWRRVRAKLLRAAGVAAAFLHHWVAVQHVNETLRTRFIEARSHEIELSGALEERRQLRQMRHAAILGSPSLVRSAASRARARSSDESRSRLGSGGGGGGGGFSPDLHVDVEHDQSANNLSAPATPRHLRPSLLDLADAAEQERDQLLQQPFRQLDFSQSQQHAGDSSSLLHDQPSSFLSSPHRQSQRQRSSAPTAVDRAYRRAISRSVATIVAVEIAERQRIAERERIELRRVHDSWHDLEPTLRHIRNELNSRQSVVAKWIEGYCDILAEAIEPVMRDAVCRSEAARRRYLRVMNHNVGQRVILVEEARERRQLEEQEARIVLFLAHHSVMYTVMEQLQDQLSENQDARARFERNVAAQAQLKVSSLLSGGGGGSSSSRAEAGAAAGGGAASGSSGGAAGHGDSNSVLASKGTSRVASIVRQAVAHEREPLHIRVQRSVYLQEADCLYSILSFVPDILKAEEAERTAMLHQMQREGIATQELSRRRRFERGSLNFTFRFGVEFQLFLLPIVERDIRVSTVAVSALYYADMQKRILLQRNEQFRWEAMMAKEGIERKEIEREAQMWDTLFDDSYASPMRLLDALERDRLAVRKLMKKVQPYASEQQQMTVRGSGLPTAYQDYFHSNNSDQQNLQLQQQQQQQSTSLLPQPRRRQSPLTASLMSLQHQTQNAIQQQEQINIEPTLVTSSLQFPTVDDRTIYLSPGAAAAAAGGASRSFRAQVSNAYRAGGRGGGGGGVGGGGGARASSTSPAHHHHQDENNFADDLSPNSRILKAAGAVARPAVAGAGGGGGGVRFSAGVNRSTSRASSPGMFGLTGGAGGGGAGYDAEASRRRRGGGGGGGGVPLSTEQQLMQQVIAERRRRSALLKQREERRNQSQHQ